jgi:DNA-directed RNA polymerase specialized sigma24 family protein
MTTNDRFAGQLREILERRTEADEIIERHRAERAACQAHRAEQEAAESQQIHRQLSTFRHAALRLAYRELEEWFDAEDAVQEAMLLCWLHQDAYNAAAGCLKNWFLKAVHNCCQQIKRRRDGLRPLPAPKSRRRPGVDTRPAVDYLADLSTTGAEPSVDGLDGGAPTELASLICRLTPRQQQVVSLHLMGHDRLEIAGSTHLCVKTVDEHLRCARSAIRQDLQAQAAPANA